MPSEQLQNFAWRLRLAWRGQGEGQVAGIGLVERFSVRILASPRTDMSSTVLPSDIG